MIFFELQCELYKAVVSYWEDGLQDDTTKVLPLNVIMMLKKICNHPKLMKKENPSNENSSISNSIFEVSASLENVDLLSYLKAKDTNVPFAKNCNKFRFKIFSS